MRLAATAFVAGLLASGCATAADTSRRDALHEQCKDDRVEADVRIEACTAAIASGARYAWEVPFRYLDRANAWLEKEEYDKALADTERAVQLAPTDQLMLLARGMAHTRAGNAKAGLADMDAAVALAPDKADGYRIRGTLMLTANAYPRVLEDFNKVIEIGPVESFDYESRGAAYLGLKQPLRALTDLDEAIRREAINVNALALRADAYRQLLNYPKAMKDANEAIHLEPDNAKAYSIRGSIWSDQEEYLKAIPDADAAAAKAPRNFVYQANRCSIRLLADVEMEQALPGCDAALELRPRHPDILSTRGTVLLKLGRVDAAKADFGACVDEERAKEEAKRDELDYAFCLYGQALAVLKDDTATTDAKAQAAKDLTEATELRPDVRYTFASYGVTP